VTSTTSSTFPARAQQRRGAGWLTAAPISHRQRTSHEAFHARYAVRFRGRWETRTGRSVPLAHDGPGINRQRVFGDRRTPRFPERPCSPDVPRQRLVGLCSGDIARARPSSTAAASVGSSSGAPAVKAGSATSNAATAGTHPPGPPAGRSDLVRARGIHPQPGQDQRPCQLTCLAGPENAASIAARDQPPDFSGRSN
jgi:hypothetical protein